MRVPMPHTRSVGRNASEEQKQFEKDSATWSDRLIMNVGLLVPWYRGDGLVVVVVVVLMVIRCVVVCAYECASE